MLEKIRSIGFIYINQIILIVLVLTFSLGYSVLQTSLQISGDLAYRKQGILRIVNVELASSNESTILYNPTYLEKETTVGSNLSTTSSTIEYTITFENLSSDYMDISIDSTTNTNSNVTCSISGLSSSMLINPSETKTVTLKQEYTDKTSLPESTSDECTITFKYSTHEYTASEVSYSSSYTTKTTVQEALEELYGLYNN